MVVFQTHRIHGTGISLHLQYHKKSTKCRLGIPYMDPMGNAMLVFSFCYGALRTPRSSRVAAFDHEWFVWFRKMVVGYHHPSPFIKYKDRNIYIYTLDYTDYTLVFQVPAQEVFWAGFLGSKFLNIRNIFAVCNMWHNMCTYICSTAQLS